MTEPHEQLARRIQVLWMAVTGSDHPRGAYSWFARRVDVAPHTIRKWVTGAHAPASGDQPGAEKAQNALIMLGHWEDVNAAEVVAATKRWRLYWAHKRVGERQTLFEKGR